jgi:alkaline phosphatase D
VTAAGRPISPGPISPGPISRRALLGRAGAFAGAGLLATSPVWRAATAAGAAELLPNTWRTPFPLFALGVASGEPGPNGVVLWTRLAPEPLSPLPGAGVPPADGIVVWEIADDDAFTVNRRSGLALAPANEAHSVHVEVRDLAPDRWYWYRFHAYGQTSATGRTRTAPAANAATPFTFAFSSCQQWREGFYTAHRALASESVDVVVFLGDYIYESSPLGGPRPDALAPHLVSEPIGLDDYRRRYGLYKLDPDLQAAHAAFPWIVTFDDHEIDNNWADEVPQDPGAQPPAQFLARRAAGLQAFWEHLPLRRAAKPAGIDMQAYRRLDWGRMARLHMLDTRQYRSDQITSEAASNDPARTMLGAAQEAWLLDGLDRSGATWNLIGNQVFMAENDRIPGPTRSFDFDNWDGYRAPRQRLLDFLAERRPANPVVLTGDRHATWACDLLQDFSRPRPTLGRRASPVVGAEIVGTSISSGGNPDRTGFELLYGLIKAESPHWKYLNNERGYVRCAVGPAEIAADLRVVDTVTAPQANVMTRASFVVENGRPGITVR